ncbi:hypothetical protein HL653_03185 [Sphingomonas sp. AP4-R1]|uniref:hypothetical protein n=1 Tax=Sphingomonas sp. AP4-R1 TaxID=2735134 RepID=UPI001493AC65|nr:hypothetical protein [Sphingomonas sp. AP4-R1]QJU56928.1 hypothetical protein HL653_03185 [Sphingomonas sp. AP4-R1]
MVSNDVAIAIANMAIFFEFCSDDTLDPDTAIQVMEQLSGDLQALDENSRRELAASFLAISSRYEGEVRAFVEDMPHAFGIEES